LDSKELEGSVMSDPIPHRREIIGLDRVDWFLLLGVVVMFALIILFSFWNDPVSRVNPPSNSSEELIHVGIPSDTSPPTMRA